MPKKQTKILFLALLLTDILFIGIFIFIFIFTKGLIAKSIDIEDQIKTELKKENIATLMKDDIALGKAYQEQMSNYVIKSDGTVQFIEILEKLVSESDLRPDIRNVSTEPYNKTNNQNVELLRINMDITGEWQNIQFFLKALENYPLEITIDKISLNKISDYNVKGKKMPQWSGSLNFTVIKIKDTK